MTASRDATFVIGDVHGHLPRLEALLEQEGLLDRERGIRLRPEVRVIQLGDLGHFGMETQDQDRMTWHYGTPWLDDILWGNHDRFVVSGLHAFGGCRHPFPETREKLLELRRQKRLQLATDAHGFLLTHAGLAPVWMDTEEPRVFEADADSYAQFLCDLEENYHDEETVAVRDAVSPLRGGWSKERAGGVLWRDATEPLYTGFRQIFGHTSYPNRVRYYDEHGKQSELREIPHSYCIDVGTKDNGRLCGIWLPDERVVEARVAPGDAYL